MARTASALPPLNIVHAEQRNISLGFIVLTLQTEWDEAFTVPMEDTFTDGTFYVRQAESVMGGKRRTVKFRFIR